MSLKLASFEFNPFGEITYIVWDPTSHEAAIVDAGMSNDRERAAIDHFLAEHSLTVKYLINTHMHIDHSFGISYIKDNYHVGVSASPYDEPLSKGLEQQAVMFHLPFKVDNVEIDHPLHDGDALLLGDNELTVIRVPGHTPGGIALYDAADKFVLTGDSLFHSSIGRTDLPGGDHATLVKAVTDRLLTLPGDTTVYPGHGPATSIAHERTFNPYL